MATTAESGFEHEVFDDAKDLLAALRLSDDRWSPGPEGLKCHWAFRGHKRHTWKLLPSLWREECKESLATVRRKAYKLAQCRVGSEADTIRLSRRIEVV